MGTLNVNNINGGQLGGFRNLIINGNFQVNQRNHYSITEETSGTPATGYHYDRWYYDGTYLYQGVEDKSVANGTYTLSWVDAGSDITAAYVVSTDTTAGDGPNSGLTGWNTVLNGGNITVNEGTEYSKHLWVRFSGTLSNLSKVQLEHGTQATAFEHRPYGTELALCQRYYEKSYPQEYAPGSATFNGSVIFIANRNPGLPHYGLRFSTKKRITPAVTIYNSNDGTSGEIRNVDDSSDISASINRLGDSGATIFSWNSTSLGKFLSFHYTADAEL